MKSDKKVKMWIALDCDGKEVLIDDAEQGKDYFCCSCGNIVRARAKNSNEISEHFYHLETCNCNSEDILHRYWKNNLVGIGEKIKLPNIGEVKCIDKRVEFTFNKYEKIYRPDLIIKTDNPNNQFIIQTRRI